MWHPRTLNFEEMEQLKKVMLADMKIVVIGGTKKYHSPDDLAAFFNTSTEHNYNKHIDIAHVAEFFMGGSLGAAEVYHFPAVDGQEMSKEGRSFGNRTGHAIDLSEEELERRVEELFQEEIVRLADAISLCP